MIPPRARDALLIALLLPLAAACGGSRTIGPFSEEALRANAAGSSLLAQQKWTEAEATFRKALASAPQDTVLLNNLGIALDQQGKSDDAADAWARALAADGTNLHARFNLGLHAKNAGRLDEALEHLRGVAAADRDDATTRYHLGSILARKGDTAGAERELRAALERDPANVSSLYALGRTLLEQGRTDEGTAAVARSQELRARLGGSGLDATIGTVYGEQGPYAMALDHPVAALAAPPAIAVTFARAPLPEGEIARWIAAPVAGDFDGDGGVEAMDLPDAAAAAAADLDHDGDLDLAVCAGAGCTIRVNAGNGAFIPSKPGSWNAAAGVLGVVPSDIDNDRDIDLLTAGATGIGVFTNERDGTFADRTSSFAVPGGPATALAIADLDKDRRMDLVVAGPSGVSILFHRGRAFDPPAPLAGSAGGPGGGSGITVFDLDNDGFLDVAAGSPGAPLALWRNLGGRRFEPYATPRTEGVPVAAWDSDADGDLDIVLSSDAGTSLLRNDGGNAQGWTEVALTGVRDNRHGIGTKVEIVSGALRQKFEVTRPLPVHMGLGERKPVDAVRLLWPGGVIQDELDPAAGRTNAVTQLDRKGTSCPLLYARRGGRWAFVTDFLGGCAIGYQRAPGVFSVPDTDEVVRIEGGLDAEDGELALRLNNQLEEVIFFDRAELVVVDHPDGTEVYPNERLMPEPPFPAFRFFASSSIRPVARAIEIETGRDVTDRLRERDRSWPDGFATLPFKGYAAPHTLELDLGAFPAGVRAVLLLDGWIDYADSSSNIAASQAGAALVPPILSVPDGRGGWVESPGRMGFPAGLPKTMTVDLTGAFRSGAADRRIRIATSMRIYWDRARLMLGGEDVPLRVERLAPERAELRFGGFPAETSPDGKPPFAYDPENVSDRSPWKTHAGAYTAFGDVSELLLGVDDRFAITRNGDEIELRFREPRSPTPGWTRTYFLYADGFGKDMDPNSAANDRVDPMPFHGMPVYPYPERVAPPVRAAPSRSRVVPPASDGMTGALPPPSPSPADLVVRGGLVVDGTGAPPKRADVVVREGRIVFVGDASAARARRTLDASGAIVAPGFIDVHSHADAILLAEPAVRARLLAAKIAQGVTTLVVGNCGLGVAPTDAASAPVVAAVNGWMTPDGVAPGPMRLGEFLDRVAGSGLPLNVAALVPHGPVRIAAMGLAPGRPDASQLRAMRSAVAEALDEGAFGLSVGLIYPPGMYSDTEELVTLAQEAARRDGLFTAHVRGSSETLLDATRELVEIARRAGVRTHHSHLEAVGRRFWPDVAEVLGIADAARASGVRITHDVFPYTRAATMMAAIFPPWALEGGVTRLIERLRDPATRETIRREVAGRVPEWPPWTEGGWPHNLVEAVGWDGIRVASVRPGERSTAIGRSIAELGAARRIDPFDAVADLMIEEGGQVGQQVDEISGIDGETATLESILFHPAAAVVSDAEDYGRGSPHPAHAGAFARALRLGRERGEPVETTVRRMTGYPAALLGIADRGTIRPGAAADLVVLDPSRVADRATWDDPRRPAEGIRWVVVAGRPVAENGRFLGGNSGRVLRRR